MGHLKKKSKRYLLRMTSLTWSQGYLTNVFYLLLPSSSWIHKNARKIGPAKKSSKKQILIYTVFCTVQGKEFLALKKKKKKTWWWWPIVHKITGRWQDTGRTEVVVLSNISFTWYHQGNRWIFFTIYFL